MTTFDRRQVIKNAAAITAGSIFGIPLHVAAQAAKGGVLVIGSTQVPRHLNSAVQSGIATMLPAAQLFASPIRMDKNWKPQPYLAERWDLSSDNRSVTLYLRKDAVFHDGRPVTAEDVKFSIEGIRDNHPFRTMYGPVNAVTINDTHTAVVRLSEPHPALLLAMSTSLTPIIPKHIFGDGTDLKVHPRNVNPIGSGPFRLVEFKPGELMILDAFDRFFGKGTPRLQRIIIRFFKDPSSQLLAFERGEIDVHAEASEPKDIERLRRVPNVTLEVGSAPAIGPVTWLAFNTKNPKLTDKRVRQAINFGIDKKTLVDVHFGGVPRRATGPIVAGSPFFSADVEPYAFNPQKAIQMLEEAGLKPNAAGVRLSLEMDYLGFLPLFSITADFIKASLAKVGVEVTLRNSPDLPTWMRRIAGMQFDMTIDNVWNWGDPVIGVHRTWLSSNIKPGVIWSNTQSYANAKVDELLGNAGKEMNLAKRKAFYKEAQKLIVEDCPVAFLMESRFHTAFHNRVQERPQGIWGLVDGMTDTNIKS